MDQPESTQAQEDPAASGHDTEVVFTALPEVNQAGGMLMVQLDCSIGEAMTFLHHEAHLRHRPVAELARAVLAGTTGFSGPR